MNSSVESVLLQAGSTLTQSGGSLTSSISIQVGNINGAAIYNMSGSGASISTALLNIVADSTFGQTAGIVSTTTLKIGNDASASQPEGFYNLSGGTLTTTHILIGNNATSSNSNARLTWTGGAIGATDITLNYQGRFTLAAIGTAGSLPSLMGIILGGQTNNGNGGVIQIDSTSSSLTVNGVISGSASLSKKGDGILALIGSANSFSGGLYIDSGSLQISNASSMGTDGVTVAADSTFDMNGVAVSGHSLTLNGVGVNSVGALINTSTASATWSGSVVLSTASSIGGTGVITLSGIISGTSALTKVGSSTLTLSGNNTYSGGTTVSAGMLTLGSHTALGTDGVTVNSGAILNVNNFSPTVSSLSGAGSVTLGTGTLTAGNNNANSTFSGILSGSSGSLIKIGTGTLTLTLSTTNNTYSGGTSINGGTLAIAGDGSVGGIPGSPAVNLTFDGGGGGTLMPTADFSLNANRSILLSSNATFNTNAHTLTLLGTIGGAGTFTKTGAGTLILTGNNSYSGTTTLSTGTLQIGNNTTTGSLGTGNVINNATLAFKRTDNVNVNNTISGGGTLTHLGTGTTTLTAYNATGSIAITAGTLALGSTAGTRQTSAVLVQSSSVSITNPGTGRSVLDITNHDMMIPNNNTTSYGTIMTLVNNGMVNLLGLAGSSTGPQITSSIANNYTGSYPTILVAFEIDSTFGAGVTGDGSGIGFSDPGYTDNVTITQPGTVMVKYGYYGDINFDGKVDAFDITLAQGELGHTTPGLSDIGQSYLYGDVDGDGTVTSFDVVLIQGQLGAGTGGSFGDPLVRSGVSINLPGSTGAAPVPEPASLFILGFGSAMVLFKRKAR